MIRVTDRIGRLIAALGCLALIQCGGGAPPPAPAASGGSGEATPNGPAVLDVSYAPSVAKGETLTLVLRVKNGAETPAKVLPMAVVLSRSGGELVEGYGNSFTLAPGEETNATRVDVPTRALESDTYHMSVILLDAATEKRVGDGKFHQPFEVRP